MNVTLVAAVSNDGFIARDAHDPLAWTGSADKEWFRTITTEISTVIMGYTTFKTIGHPLPDRHIIVMSRSVHTERMPGVTFTNLDPKALIKALRAQGTATVAVCGGAAIYEAFLAANLVDEAWISIIPVNLGKGIAMPWRALESNLSVTTPPQATSTLDLRYYVRKAPTNPLPRART